MREELIGGSILSRPTASFDADTNGSMEVSLLSLLVLGAALPWDLKKSTLVLRDLKVTWRVLPPCKGTPIIFIINYNSKLIYT